MQILLELDFEDDLVDNFGKILKKQVYIRISIFPL